MKCFPAFFQFFAGEMPELGASRNRSHWWGTRDALVAFFCLKKCSKSKAWGVQWHNTLGAMPRGARAGPSGREGLKSNSTRALLRPES